MSNKNQELSAKEIALEFFVVINIFKEALKEIHAQSSEDSIRKIALKAIVDVAEILESKTK